MSKASIVGDSKGRPSDDFYPTPEMATRALLSRERFSGRILEPACGDGAISKLLPGKVTSIDLYDHGYGRIGVDFLSYAPKEKFDHIVTNPPYRDAKAFIEKSLKVTTGKVAMLLKLVFLEGERRKKMLQDSPLRTVYIFSKRLKLTRNGDEYENGGMICFAWFVWEHGYKGKPEIEWI